MGMRHRHKIGRFVVGATMVSTVLLAAPGTSKSSAAPHQSAPCDVTNPNTCTLAELADLIGLRIGATAEADQVPTGLYAETLAREFNSITPENALKWYSVQNSEGVWNFAPADAIVDFAEANGMVVRGHTLLWAQDDYTPAWVKSITDRAQLESAVNEQIATVVGRYRGRIPRWDVVNEPIETLGTGPSNSVFWRVLGPDWIGDAFRAAHAADPQAELWINEVATEWLPGKHDALLSLVKGLLDDGVPIHGVGFQGHRFNTTPVDKADLVDKMDDFTTLGLRVAITELDVATHPTDPDQFAAQADVYRTMFEACLSVDGCDEVTMWGITDSSSWLDSLGYLTTPTRPLLFDEAFARKPAYWAVHEVLAAVANPAPPTSTTMAPTTTTSAPTTTSTTLATTTPTPITVPGPRTKATPAQPRAARPTFTG